MIAIRPKKPEWGIKKTPKVHLICV
jgi:hypothetical protein